MRSEIEGAFFLMISGQWIAMLWALGMGFAVQLDRVIPTCLLKSNFTSARPFSPVSKSTSVANSIIL